MSQSLHLIERAVVVAGAGGGLGKTYALHFADAGASVGVNNLRGTSQGNGSSQRAGDSVGKEILKRGGKAVLICDSVTEEEKVIETAVQKFGRIDNLVNNAGTLRYRSFAKMTLKGLEFITQVHVVGFFKTGKAARNYFRNQNYSRNTSWVARLLRNFGQSTYSAAKSDLVRLSNTLAKEDAPYISTMALVESFRLTENQLPSELHAALKPDIIAPVVAWLCHGNCDENRVVIEADFGFVEKCRWYRAGGAALCPSSKDNVTVEYIRDKWSQIADLTRSVDYSSASEEALGKLRDALRLAGKVLGDLEIISRANVSQLPFSDIKIKGNVNQTIFHALGSGIRLTDEGGMNHLYESSDNSHVVPIFPVVPAIVDMLYKIYVYVNQVTGKDEQGPVFNTKWHAFEVGGGKFCGPEEAPRSHSQDPNETLTPSSLAQLMNPRLPYID